MQQIQNNANLIMTMIKVFEAQNSCWLWYSTAFGLVFKSQKMMMLICFIMTTMRVEVKDFFQGLKKKQQINTTTC